MKNVMIYTRVSTDTQGNKGLSLRRQENELSKYCMIRNYNVIGEYKDNKPKK